MIGVVYYLLKLIQYPLAHKIEPNIYLGGMDAVESKPFMDKHEIGAVLNCSTDIPFISHTTSITKARISVHDDLSIFSIRSFYNQIPEAVRFIDRCLQQHIPILIHCRCGMQRSVSILASYFMWRDDLTVDQAIHKISSIRKLSSFPVCNFRIALDMWYQDLHHQSSSYPSKF